MYIYIYMYINAHACIHISVDGYWSIAPDAPIYAARPMSNITCMDPCTCAPVSKHAYTRMHARTHSCATAHVHACIYMFL